MNELQFSEKFRELTGYDPLPWQWRLFRDHFLNGQPYDVIDLPTGLGKTMVMAIWLIARKANPKLPRRLVYVVDRRTVVDQATDLATKLQKSLGDSGLVVSTLRGQLADNRKWSQDLSRPAIIVGTVDLIGSALLFSGYRSSFRRRPLEAGLLGQDSLLVLDEAHLSKPFEKLVTSIANFQQGQGLPMRVIRMSATSGESDGEAVFALDPSLDLRAGDETAVRFSAPKRLRIKGGVDKKKLNVTLSARAIELAEDDSLKGKRIVVFVRSPGDAKTIEGLIRDHEIKTEDATGNKARAVKSKPYANSVAVLTGTMRGLERDELVERKKKGEPASPQNRVMQRFLDGDIDPADEKNREPVFLVSTSAGEVGFDLNADHMVCDAAPLDSMIQRLGRVNRRGKGDAVVYLVPANDPPDKSDIEKASIAASELFHEGMDLSPKALAEFRSTLSSETLKIVSTPEPTMVELTDILLDAWSMTSIIERMPGRPEVAPWLRGIEKEQSQTTIAWRAELALVNDHPQPAKALQRIFAKHRIRPHEAITLNTGQVLEFLKQLPKLKDRSLDLLRTRVALRMTRGEVVLRSIEQLTAEPGILYAETTLILPARFGGLDSAGMLDVEAIPKSPKPDDPPPPSLDVADQPGYEQDPSARGRLRIVIEKTEDEWKPMPLPGEAALPGNLNLEASYPRSRELFDTFKDAGYRVRLVQPLAFDDEGDHIRSLVMLSPLGNKSKKEKQLLTEHVGAVEKQALRIADDLKLDAGDSVRSALLFAAKWHDEGKKAEVWQRFAYGSTDDGQWLGKMVVTRDPKALRRYRHEFGSLLRIHYAERHHTTGCELPTDETTRDLALHLIATHHGAGRPHFNDAIYAPFTDGERDTLHTESIRRFAKLQTKYGYWRLAWLENLLRCADALASESVTGSADDQEDEIEGDSE